MGRALFIGGPLAGHVLTSDILQQYVNAPHAGALASDPETYHYHLAGYFGAALYIGETLAQQDVQESLKPVTAVMHELPIWLKQNRFWLAHALADKWLDVLCQFGKQRLKWGDRVVTHGRAYDCKIHGGKHAA